MAHFSDALDAVKSALNSAGDADFDAHAVLVLVTVEDFFNGDIPPSRSADFYADLFTRIKDLIAAQAVQQ